jgi:hypothetical protein
LNPAYKEEINDSKIDEIYQKIDDYCKQQEGISEVPVVFMWAQDEENLPLPDMVLRLLKKLRSSYQGS